MSNILKRRGKEKRKKLEAGLAGDMLPPGTMLVSFKKYVLSGMPSDSIIGAIDRNVEIWNFADNDGRQDVIQAVRTKTEKK